MYELFQSTHKVAIHLTPMAKRTNPANSPALWQ
ncbi:hypothetical protein Pan181_19560 [Aeoliella mucimassa]|uniref:Uncharacterized protein n=1 Tax=Aeoliella mucimassa TaxID=2527972 RepID=A0A518AM11_9BACT|nr:hypothetical protein Pan181_19560 [Aeoliella mucimassa]